MINFEIPSSKLPIINDCANNDECIPVFLELKIEDVLKYAMKAIYA